MSNESLKDVASKLIREARDLCLSTLCEEDQAELNRQCVGQGAYSRGYILREIISARRRELLNMALSVLSHTE
jgi:hypothetical protein